MVIHEMLHEMPLRNKILIFHCVPVWVLSYTYPNGAQIVRLLPVSFGSCTQTIWDQVATSERRPCKIGFADFRIINKPIQL